MRGPLRLALTAHLGRPCMLRTDRERSALFITDAGQFGNAGCLADFLRPYGWVMRDRGNGLLALDLSRAMYRHIALCALARPLTQGALDPVWTQAQVFCAALTALPYRGLIVDGHSLPALRDTLLPFMPGGDCKPDSPLLRQHAACLLRKGYPGVARAMGHLLAHALFDTKGVGLPVIEGVRFQLLPD